MYEVVALGEALIDFTMVSADAQGYPTMAAHPGGAPPIFWRRCQSSVPVPHLYPRLETTASAVCLWGRLRKPE